jgi:CBS domain-containing protein
VIEMKIEQLMQRDVVTATPETTLKEVARLLTRHHISGVPVCDADGGVLGVVSEADILHKEEGGPPAHGGIAGRLRGRRREDERWLHARTAAEAMTAPALTVTPAATAAAAARLMSTRGVNRLPVLDDGRLVGIVSRADLVRAFQRSDEEIEEEIVGDVLLGELWISPREVRISVVDGVVELAGRLDNRTEAELLAGYVRRVPGVVDVRADLTWRVDDVGRRP